jgi:hypothetical protein
MVDHHHRNRTKPSHRVVPSTQKLPVLAVTLPQAVVIQAVVIQAVVIQAVVIQAVGLLTAHPNTAA